MLACSMLPVMRSVIWVLLAVSLVGCDNLAARTMTRHDALTLDDGCQLKEVWTDSDLTDPEMADGFQVARDLLLEYHVVSSGADYCQMMTGMKVSIWSSFDIELSDGRPLSGLYKMGQGITIGRDMSALVHETFHAIEFSECDLLSGTHLGWTDRRHNGLSNYDLDVLYGLTLGAPHDATANPQQH